VPTPPRPAGWPGLIAAVMIGLQALSCAGSAVLFLFLAPKRASLSVSSHLMFSAFTLLIAVGLGLVARGMWHGLSWPRTAAFAWFVILLPLGWAVFQAGMAPVGLPILASALVGIGAVTQEIRDVART
jgi:hypothetical protein